MLPALKEYESNFANTQQRSLEIAAKYFEVDHLRQPSSGSPAADNAFSRSSLSKNPGCPTIADPHSPACNGPLPGEKPAVFTGVQSITPPR